MEYFKKKKNIYSQHILFFSTQKFCCCFKLYPVSLKYNWDAAQMLNPFVPTQKKQVVVVVVVVDLHRLGKGLEKGIRKRSH